jgi:uncharacterized transporter YbjL
LILTIKIEEGYTLKTWKNLILFWFVLLASILVYSVAFEGGINIDDYSKYLGVLFWVVTIAVSVYPLIFIVLNRKSLQPLVATKLFLIAILCPFVGSLYVFLNIKNNQVMN